MTWTNHRAVVAGLVLVLTALAPVALGSDGVPPIVRFSGTLPDTSGSVMVTFTLHADQTGGAVLWLERQLVVVDEQGRYTVRLGAASPDGLPAGVFATGEARWLGVQADGAPPLPRVMLVSVPYALKAGDAETIGGRPLSSFVLAGETTGKGADGLTYVNTRLLEQGLAAAGGAPPSGGTADTAGTAGYIGRFTDSVNLGNSVIFQSGTSIGVGTTSPEVAFHAKATSAPGAFIDVYSNTLGALPMVYRAARGTPASPAAVQTDDILGGLAVRGHDGTTFSGGRGQVMFKAAENWTPSAQGTYLSMATVPLGGLGPAAERIRVAPNGYVGFGTSAPEFPIDARLGRVYTYARFGQNADIPLYLMAHHPQIGFNAYNDGAYRYGLGSAAGYIAFGQDIIGGFSFGTAASGTQGSVATMIPRIVIANDGRVGINTTNPSARLEVVGDVKAERAVFVESTEGGTAVVGQANQGVSAWGVFGRADEGVGVYGAAAGATGTGGRFVHYFNGKALTASVASIDVLTVDGNGVHAGPGMTPTPVAHGFFDAFDASRKSGSTNITCTWDGVAVLYRCTITDHSFFYQHYTTSVTPTAPVVATVNSSEGRLLVTFYNLAGTPVKPTGGFSLAVFKQ